MKKKIVSCSECDAFENGTCKLGAFSNKKGDLSVPNNCPVKQLKTGINKYKKAIRDYIDDLTNEKP